MIYQGKDKYYYLYFDLDLDYYCIYNVYFHLYLYDYCLFPHFEYLVPFYPNDML